MMLRLIRGRLDQFLNPTGYHFQAFLNEELVWHDYAYSRNELQQFKNEAIESGFTFLIENVPDY
jgi:hypothetical protein|tara:strand:+ start:118 stop:309 length:192 start_codon:yes stop_codon:yes gene_type:complete